eukprot:8865273-Pyramimonas_sp.AAC.1
MDNMNVCFADLARVANPSSYFWMQQTSAHNDSEPVSVRIKSVAPLQPELRAKTDSTSQDDSNITDSFTNLARVADRVWTSKYDRRTRLMRRNRFL